MTGIYHNNVNYCDLLVVQSMISPSVSQPFCGNCIYAIIGFETFQQQETYIYFFKLMILHQYKTKFVNRQGRRGIPFLITINNWGGRFALKHLLLSTPQNTEDCFNTQPNVKQCSHSYFYSRIQYQASLVSFDIGCFNSNWNKLES